MKLVKKAKRKIEDFVFKKLMKASRNRRVDVESSIWWSVAKKLQDNKLEDVLMNLMLHLRRNNENLESAGVTDIMVLGDNVVFYLKRPGILIGKGGERIDAIRHGINHYKSGKTGEFVMEFDYRITLIEDNRSGMAEFYRLERMLECI